MRAEALAPVPFGRLVQAELRKTTDTRAGRVLLAGLALLAGAAVVVVAVWGEPEERSFAGLLLLAQLPVGLLLPVLAALTATGEWSTRTALTTFSLVPRRELVVAAKLVAVVLLALVLVVASTAAAGTAALLSDAPPADDGVPGPPLLVRVVLFQVVVALVGLGLGLLLLRGSLAICAWFLLPLLLGALTQTVPPLRPVSPWLDLLQAAGRLLGDPVRAREWAELGTACALWAALPLVAGLLRVRRSDLR